MTRPVLEPWQYRIAETPLPGARQLGRFWLESATDLPLTKVQDSNGADLGVLLGFPIDLDAKTLLGDTWTVPVALTPDSDSGAFALSVLARLAGRFLWIFVAEGVARIYPDASTQVPCVYDPKARIAGATALALYDAQNYDSRFDRGLYDRLGVQGEGWYPGGLTAHVGLFRVLPNHMLDLETWQSRRVRPQAPYPVLADPEAAVDEIIAIVRAQIEALVSGPKRVAMALTAGHETRMLLACARPWLDQVDFVTVSGDDRHKTDTTIARRIATDLGLRHITLPRLEATPEQRARFIRRGGHCNADSNSLYHPSVWPLADSHVFVGGLGGEIARSFLWKPSDTPQTEISVDTLVGRFGLPGEACLSQAIGAWHAALPAGMDAFGILDLAYHENRNGPWYAAQFYSDPTLVRHAPLMTDRIVERMLCLPPAWKRAGRLNAAVISRLWPELARYPYNSLGRWHDAWLRLRRVAGDPRVVIKKLRKLRS